MSIDKRLQIVIKMSGLNNGSFADKIGVQRSSITHVLTGRNKPSIDFIEKVLETFPNVDANWLVSGRKVGRFIDDNKSITPNISSKLPSESKIINEEEPIVYGKQNSPNQRKITRIIIFYDDGTYDEK